MGNVGTVSPNILRKKMPFRKLNQDNRVQCYSSNSLQYSEVRWKIAPPFGHLKIIQNLFGVTGCGFHGTKMLKNAFAPCLGSLQCSPLPRWIKIGLILTGGKGKGQEAYAPPKKKLPLHNLP